jgi:YfiR/HmsC-like
MAILIRRLQPWLVVLAACACLPASAEVAHSEGLTESEIKAGFLYNFTKFVEWPSEVFTNASTPIVLGIVGANPFGRLLTDAAAGKTVNGRGVLIKHFREDEDLKSCQIVFVSSLEKKRAAQIVEKLGRANVLTVGEGDAFIEAGGMIAFVVEGNKVRLVMNLEAASEARLKISAKVIAVALRAGREPRAKN